MRKATFPGAIKYMISVLIIYVNVQNIHINVYEVVYIYSLNTSKNNSIWGKSWNQSQLNTKAFSI